jgi:hypothetical protein
MRGHRTLISFLALAACCSLMLADTLNFLSTFTAFLTAPLVRGD